ncbi:MAG: DUF4091 domain-containing protein [Spiroplasma poulsonii]|uniref:Uncharacterized protein n=1 Tax=Spiroplasma poulsonii TaxID=2138 RepID=A0A2P6FDG3_9MOLU|nr:glycoside hydrolase domain-containing protein [Spiroplasma poulsonii]KAF0850880.1 hypothetical protein MSROBK_013610 [Spiroplasma poulsonii]MBW1242222.1 DUF4091 domain-containing protein [Spiroplasma poulsonii]PQM31503.1 hypothetical protein SMSRO_SF013380 [Spiroplasma poulsonii]PWF96518.1 hypothetical protein SMSE_19650 [Spiroplasma poulsonii]PWF97094.1 hypothetical protein SMH99_19030 [Spiroplasma poulsonii]
MFKKISMSLILVLTIFTAVVTIVLFAKKDSFMRSVWLDGCEPTTQIQSKDKTPYAHTFFGSQHDNYALYQPNEVSNDLKDAQFYGNLENYNNCINPNVNLQLWKQDFINTQLIVKTNNYDITNLTATVTNAAALEKNNLTVQIGFNRFIYASYSLTNQKIPNPYGINEKLLVPDAITTNSVEKTAYKNKVYVLWIKIMSFKDKIVANPGNYPVKVQLTGDVPGTKQTNVILNENEIQVKVNDLLLPAEQKKSDFNIYSFFGWSAAYYNNYQVPNSIKNKYDNIEYIDYNWEHYWEPEHKYLHNVLGMDYFQSSISLNERKNTEWHNNWLDGNKVQTFLPLRYNQQKGLYIADEDWKAWDHYMNKMAEVGYTKALLSGWQAAWNKTYKTNNVWDEDKQDYMQISMNMYVEDGVRNNEWFLQQLLNHIKTGNPKWTQTVTPYLYIDELPGSAIGKYLALIQKYDPNRKYIKLAACDWERDIDYKDPATYEVDILHIYFLDIYNEQNSKFINLVKQRNEKGYITGQYSLDVDNTFNLIRSEPGVSSYIQLALLKENAPHYMRYLLNGWTKTAYWSADYDEHTGLIYIAGDTMFAYPSIANPDPNNNNKAAFNPSTRLDAIAYGINMNNKIMYLKKLNLLSNYTTMMSYVNSNVKLSKPTSRTKFDFNYNGLTAESDIKISNSFLYRFLTRNNIDEVMVVKTFENIINKVVTTHLGG